MACDPTESNSLIIRRDDLEQKRIVWLLSTFGLAGTAVAAVTAEMTLADSGWINPITAVVATALLISGLIIFMRHSPAARKKTRMIQSGRGSASRPGLAGAADCVSLETKNAAARKPVATKFSDDIRSPAAIRGERSL